MTITVRLFAVLRERAGVSETPLTLADHATIAQAATALASKVPAIADYLPRVAFAVNQSYADRATDLNDGDELALIPPVSGGCS